MRSPLDLIFNFHWVVPGEAARSAHENFGFLRPLLRRHAIGSVINLRGHHPECRWWRREFRICEALGIGHHDAMLDSRLLPTRAMLVTLLQAFVAGRRPLLIKCSGGQDRTSFAAALYLLHRDGWGAREAALAQFAAFPYLHFPKPQQRWLRHFFRYAQDDSGGRAIGEWVAADYHPLRFKAWLDGQGLQASYRGIFPAS